MTKIACILGSPRSGGNSETIARKIAASAEALGAEAEFFSLYKLNFKGCVACMGCKKVSDECVLKDDLSAALRAMREADILIIASPVYFGDVTGEMKRFIDRCYSHVPPDYLTGGARTRMTPGKKCVFVLTQGYPGEEMFGEAYSLFAGFFGPEWFGYEMHLVRGCGLSDPKAAGESVALMEQAEALGKQLMA